LRSRLEWLQHGLISQSGRSDSYLRNQSFARRDVISHPKCTAACRRPCKSFKKGITQCTNNTKQSGNTSRTNMAFLCTTQHVFGSQNFTSDRCSRNEFITKHSTYAARRKCRVNRRGEESDSFSPQPYYQKVNMSKWKHRLINIDTVSKYADCAACGRVGITLKSGRWKCKTARKEHRGKNHYVPRPPRPRLPRLPKPPRVRKSKSKFAHLRGKTCEICGATEHLCGDHDHTTDKFRGTLCRNCNLGIGNFKDSTALLAKAMLYLETKVAPTQG
jgi:hypothetical protein